MTQNKVELKFETFMCKEVGLSSQVYQGSGPLRIGYLVDDGFTQPSPSNARGVREVKGLLEEAGHTVRRPSEPWGSESGCGEQTLSCCVSDDCSWCPSLRWGYLRPCSCWFKVFLRTELQRCCRHCKLFFTMLLSHGLNKKPIKFLWLGQSPCGGVHSLWVQRTEVWVWQVSINLPTHLTPVVHLKTCRRSAGAGPPPTPELVCKITSLTLAGI